MGVPVGVPQFESFLRSLCLEKPTGEQGWQEWVVLPEELVYLDDHFSKLPAITIWYSEESGLSPTAVTRKISEGLKAAGHPDATDLAQIMLGFFAYTERSSGLAAVQFNKVFSEITSADLNQYFLFSVPSPPSYRFRVGEFSIGPFLPERLRYQSQKAGSDYYERYEAMLRQSQLAVQREPFSVKLVPWLKSKNCQWTWLPTAPIEHLIRLRDRYFSVLSTIHFENFFVNLDNAQEIAMALGSGWFEVSQLALLTRTNRISIYLNIAGENQGFVSPSEAGIISIDLGGAPLGIPTTENMLKKHFGIIKLTNSDIHQLIRTFCHFLALGVRHEHGQRLPEAFLHSVIALDLLLGEKTESSKTIVKRSAVLCYLPLNKSFAQAARECDMVYDARSKYVHAGQMPDDHFFDLTMRICREIAFCLLRLQRKSESHQPGFRNRWVRDIDLVAAMCEANRIPSEDDLARIGVGLKGEIGLETYQQSLHVPNAPNAFQ